MNEHDEHNERIVFKNGKLVKMSSHSSCEQKLFVSEKKNQELTQNAHKFQNISVKIHQSSKVLKLKKADIKFNGKDKNHKSSAENLLP